MTDAGVGHVGREFAEIGAHRLADSAWLLGSRFAPQAGGRSAWALRVCVRRRTAFRRGRTNRSDPLCSRVWYYRSMSGTHNVIVGDRGRIVVPAEVRARAGLPEGTSLVLLDTPGGLVLLTRAQLRARVREELEGLDLVGQLLADRRLAAEQEHEG